MNNWEMLSMTDSQVIAKATSIPYQIVYDTVTSICNDPTFINRMDPHLLKNYGMTKHMSEKFLALFHSSTRINLLRDNGHKKRKITTSKDIYDLMQFISMMEHEFFYLICLTRVNVVIGEPIMISKGIRYATLVDNPAIAKELIMCNASAFITVHNHPSGNVRPSESDKEVCNKLKSLSKIIEVNYLDNVIIAEQTYFSFADESLL